MLLAYMVLFFSNISVPTEEATEENILNAFTIFSVFAFFIPNVGIMIRRRVKTWRIAYNYLFGAINLMIAGGLIFYLTDVPWQFK
jgi:hypothetical protein